MNTVLRIAAPLVLSLAAVGAQASELAYGDIGTRPVVAAAATSVDRVGPQPSWGEVGFGDIGVGAIARGTAAVAAPAPARTALPIRVQSVVGA